MSRRTAKRLPGVAVLAAVVAAAAVFVGAIPDVMQRHLDQLAAPHTWSVVGWEAVHLGDAYQDVTTQLFRRPPDDTLVDQVHAYLEGTLPPSGGDTAALRSMLASSVAMELRDHGAPAIGGFVVPPVTLSLTQPLRLLVVSPRDEIREAYWEVLDDRFPMTSAPELEAQVEALNVSALVVDQIAIATWPTLIPANSAPSSVLQTVAHEWTHTALFFTPLGRAYGDSAQARAINETTADTVGQEIGDALMRRAGVEPPSPTAPGGRQSDFVQRMRAIRQHVDELLAQRDVVGAETYMEQQRELLVADGYRIRKLNQAYFAFFGNYAEGPTATTEVPDDIQAIRAGSGSVADFLGRIGQVTSLADLRAAASR